MNRRFHAVIPALCTSAFLVAAAAGQPVARKVLIVGIDGFRGDCLIPANAPNLDALRAAGASSLVCQAEDITVSGPGWSSICTGVHRSKHLVSDNSFSPQNYVDYPHFFARLKETCAANTASIVHWSPINQQIARDHADTLLSDLSDAGVAAAAANLVATSNPDVVFLHFDDCDGAGHSFGFDPSVPQYLAAIGQTDTYVGQVLAAIHARSTFAQEDWLVIVTSDHGGTIDGSHGRNIPEHRNTPLIISGLSTAAGTIISPNPELVDVAATVMTFLGLPIDPAWGWDGEAVGLNMAASPSQPFPCTPPPPPPLGACTLRDGRCLQIRVEACTELRGVWVGLDSNCPASPPLQQVVFAENFESLALGPNVNENTAGANVWTATPPAGWVLDNSGVPAGGVTEWRGWSFASRDWWTQAAGDQSRSAFTKGLGAVAIADPDEWDDLAHSAGTYNTLLSTRPISLAAVRAETAHLFLDSSWRPEANQTATLTVRYDGGAPITLLHWTSSGPDFKADAVNETLALDLHAPAGAQSMVLTFALTDAGNNWWWALDNLEVVATPLYPRRVLLHEDFESVPLGPSVDEAPGGNVWSGSPPTGWAFDDSGVPTVSNPASGVTEWEGWAVANRSWWSSIAGDQNRSQFTLGTGAVAIADPDEWDDRGSPSPSSIGPYTALMHTPSVSLAGVAADSLQLAFDSSWRFEAPQQARLTASFDGGPPVTLFFWDSAPGPNFKPDATNEHLTLSVHNPAGATSVRFTFALLNARNNWWWAVDNIDLTGVDAPCACTGSDTAAQSPDFNCDGSVDPDDLGDFINCYFAASACPRADFNADGSTDPDDLGDYINRFFGGC